jgi:hypothetical protein
LKTANLLVYNDARQDFKRAKRLSTDKYEWQAFPQDSFIDRLCWTTDLLFSCRGIGWNWKINGEPSRPPAVEASLRHISIAEATKQDVPETKSGRVRYRDRKQAMMCHAWTICKAYIFLDALKTIMNHDAYCWGIDNAAPPSYLPRLITASPALLSLYRTGIALPFTKYAIEFWFEIAQLFFLTAFTPDTLGANAEAWLYPAHFGNYSSIYTRGLAGFWSDYWHHLPKHGLQSGAQALTRAMNLKPRSSEAKGVELIAAFTLSGFLHAASSMTMIGPTQPFATMYLFFATQPIGIIFEIVCTYYFARCGLAKAMPKWLSCTLHVLYTHAWLGLTMPLIGHDMRRGGFLIHEPVPFSIFRGLGLGGRGDTAFCW